MSGAAITGGVLALTGTLLLLIGSSLPLAEARGLFGGVGAVTFWDDLETPGVVAILFLILIGTCLVYFAMPTPGARRTFAWISILIYVVILLGMSSAPRTGQTIIDSGFARGGIGLYVMAIALICILAGWITAGVAPARRPSPPLYFQAGIAPAPRQLPPPVQPSLAAQLRELKSLLDDGLVSQDEYDARRKRVLES